MTYSSESEIEHIAVGILDHSLPKPDWTHAAHFAAALWMLKTPERNPLAGMPDIIRAYNEATGVENTDHEGYHETITVASIRAARNFLEAAPRGRALFEIANDLLSSPFGRSDWLLTYWSKAVLFSVRARRSWVDPDIAALPFD